MIQGYEDESPWVRSANHDEYADEAATIVSKDWTHLSINSDEITKATSPFDDIGYLAGGGGNAGVAGSFYNKGVKGPISPPTPQQNNSSTTIRNQVQQNLHHQEDHP